MKNKFFAIAVVAATMMFAANAVQAQQIAKAPLPSFSAHDKTYPAGNYEVKYLGNSILRVQEVGTGNGVTIFAPSAIRQTSEMMLTFRKYDNRLFLAQISDRSQGFVADVPPSNTERKAKRANQVASIVALRASK